MTTAKSLLRENGIYMLDGEAYLARHNNDLPNGDYLVALYEYDAQEGPDGAAYLFLDLDGTTLISSLGDDERGGKGIGELAYMGQADQAPTL